MSDTIPGKPPSMTFIQAFQVSGMAYNELLSEAQKVNVPKTAVDAMVVGSPVAKKHASAMLTALSKHAGQTWNLQNVDMPLLVEGAEDE